MKVGCNFAVDRVHMHLHLCDVGYVSDVRC
jgi:hypothetical protein